VDDLKGPENATVPERIIVIVGPTASGKSELAVRLAAEFAGEIVNADSMQFYTGMEIGTARPSSQQMSLVPHHLFGIVPPDVNFTAADFTAAAGEVITDICRRGRIPFVVGGTGLYIRALLCGLAESPSADEEFRASMTDYAEKHGAGALHQLLARVDPAAAARLHINDRVRIIRALEVFHRTGKPLSLVQGGHGFRECRYDALEIGLDVARPLLYERIEKRIDAMMAAGLVGEVEQLLAQGYSPCLKAMGAIGYREICDFFRGKQTLTESVDLMKKNTRHYAKRQLTWFKKDQAIKWVDYPKTFANICGIVKDYIDRRSL
jgi:tRNA dimethylallyltransferase